MLRPQIFTRARDWPSLTGAHLHGEGGPKNVNRENLKFGLKFSVWASITSGLVGISSVKFSRRRGELWSTCKKVVPYKRKILIDPKCAFIVSWRNSIRHVVLWYTFRSHLPGGVVARGISNTIYILLHSTPCLKKTVPTYFLLLVCQIWTDFAKNWKDCSGRNPQQNYG